MSNRLISAIAKRRLHSGKRAIAFVFPTSSTSQKNLFSRQIQPWKSL
ncbi:MAG TPA: hypothetical protein V6C93_32755 [Allocoleopsis sp.]